MNSKLFAEFPEISTEQWKQTIIADLKGADYEKKLITKTVENIDIKPFYTFDDIKNFKHLKTYPAKFPFKRGNYENIVQKKINQNVKFKTETFTNNKIINITQKGINSVNIIFPKNTDFNKINFEILFNNIDITNFYINFTCSENHLDLLKKISEYILKKNINSEKINGFLTFEPITKITSEGNISDIQNFSESCNLKEIINFSQTNIPNFKIIKINAAQLADSGASIIQEIAYSLNIAVEYITKAQSLNINSEEFFKKILFNYSVSDNYFFEIAKFRAARFLWAKVAETYFPEKPLNGKMFIHAETSARNKTIYNPYLNILRTTSEAMSALIGGTDSLTVNPFDFHYKESSELSERIARNTQIILNEEAYLNKNIDAAGGSYYIEYLTDSFIHAAWELFLETEKLGGYLECLKKEIIQNNIEETVNKRKSDFARRKRTLTGSNQYPALNEEVLKNIDFSIYRAQPKNNSDFKTLNPFFESAEIEEIRLKTEKMQTKPKVFLLEYGNTAMRKARAQFALNFFACAGFEILNNTFFNNINDGISEAIKSNADITVLCSSDEEYENSVYEAFNLCKNKTMLVVAGNPNGTEDMKKQGIKNFINLKSDIISTLKYFQDKLGIN